MSSSDSEEYFDCDNSLQLSENETITKDTNEVWNEDKRSQQESLLSEEEKEDLLNKSLRMKESGNDYFRCSEFDKAIEFYSESLETCPLSFTSVRSIIFSNRAAALMKEERIREAIEDCDSSLMLNPENTKALFRRAFCYEQKEEDWDKALEDYKAFLEKHPSNMAARRSAEQLPLKIHERNEKMKDEMIDNLKKLGNLVLKPFGLSTNDFKLQQNPEGGYSITTQSQNQEPDL